MIKLLFFTFILLFLTGCSMKIETNHYKDGTKEYRDKFNNGTMIVKLKDNKCITPAKYTEKGYDLERIVELTEDCHVISIKDYSLDGKLVKTLHGYDLHKARDGFYEYLISRQRLESY